MSQSTLNSGPSRSIPITDSRGHVLCPSDPEPEPSSVVLTEGEFGTAWQRFFSDGKWHPVIGGRGRDWRFLLSRRNVVLVYDAPVRGDQ